MESGTTPRGVLPSDCGDTWVPSGSASPRSASFISLIVKNASFKIDQTVLQLKLELSMIN